MTSIEQVIAEYKAAHGEPEYRYHKRYMRWSKERRKPGNHWSPIGDGPEVTREEYEANLAQSKRDAGEAFMGRLPRDYWEYYRRMSKDGWRERLIADVQAFPPSS